jgi:radical SAM-linked protein
MMPNGWLLLNHHFTLLISLVDYKASMQPTYVQRLRLTFSKIGPTRFIGHLDLARTMERVLNRAKIPVTYTQGFNRRPRMQMASALPLGFTSDCEMIDILLDEQVDPEVNKAQLMAKMAPGIILHTVAEVPLEASLLQNCTVAAVYQVTLLDPIDTTELQQKIDALMAADSHMRQRARGRKRKPYDLRPLIEELRLLETTLSADSQPADTPTIQMRLLLQEGKTGRPDEVLHSLDLDPADARIHRTQIILADDS